jgi:hypothetical protein
MSKTEDDMSTYEARCGLTVSGKGASSPPAAGNLARQARIAIERGRRERSLATWSMLQAVFGRPEARDAGALAEAPDKPLL